MKMNLKKHKKSNGSALILVVVVTVLLSAIGIMFLMVSRASELETSAAVQSENLDNGVDTVVAKINEVLVEDLFGNNNTMADSDSTDEPYDVAAPVDSWLCDLEPNLIASGTPADSSDDACLWDHITDLWGLGLGGLVLDDLSGTPTWAPQNPVAGFYPQADADGDGVSDSRWVQIPNLTTSRGKPVFAAVRIIDNCAMLNLNNACNFYSGNVGEGIWHTDPWYYSQTGAQYNPTGRYLSELNYRFFLRGNDRDLTQFPSVKAIERAKDPTALLSTPEAFNDALIMNIENPGASYHPFDIGEELEMRNRYLLTGLPICRFEDESVACETFDRGRGDFVGGWDVALRVKRIPIENNSDFGYWKGRLGYVSSDNMSGDANNDYYDRRHLCTFYSFDRPLPTGDYSSLLNPTIDAYIAATWPVAGFASEAEYQEAIESVFKPKGTVTTNIESPLYTAAPYNNIETRRKILHLLYALREYYYDGTNLAEAANKAAQIVANIIDFSDGNFGMDPVAVDDPKDYGPFYDAAYGQQDNLDCTFITENIIEDMTEEVSGGLIPAGTIHFGLGSDTVFGYERQPFISEISVDYDNTATPNYIQNFSIELINPYDEDIDLTGWTLKIGSSYETTAADLNGEVIPASDIVNGPGRYVLYNGINPHTNSAYTHYRSVSLPMNLITSTDNTIVLTRPAPATSGETDLVVDRVEDADYDSSATQTIFRAATGGGVGHWSAVRTDSGWSFINPAISIIENGQTIGVANNPGGTQKAFQLAVPDDGEPVSRWGDIETLSLFGNPADSGDPNLVITRQIADAAADTWHYDLFPDSNDFTAGLTDYISPMNRPDYGSLPGRININTAPLPVIAAALPPSVIRLESNPNTALTVAQMIVDHRPYKNISDLLKIPFFTRLASDSQNVYFSNGSGDDQNITDDIEERDWFMTHIANKFTVRSDTFTAYILVRLGTDGPQRRMIAIFDRSQVWNKNDHPKLVALHPVPDPR